MLKIKAFTFNMFGINTYVVWNPDTLEAAVIDPGMIDEDEELELDRFISDNHLQIKHLINTHMHVDHIFGDRHIKEKYGADVMACRDDAFLGEKAAMQCRMFGLPDSVAAVEIDRELHHGDVIEIGGEQVEVLSVPGHSRKHCPLFPQVKMGHYRRCAFQGEHRPHRPCRRQSPAAH